jgi:hypothetical protein
MKASDYLHRDLSSEELRSLPREWIELYMQRPVNREQSDKRAMQLRAALLVAATLYAFFTKSGFGIVPVLLIALYFYEIGYYGLRKELSLFRWAQDHEEYLAAVAKLPDYRA